jgi:outer membrane protein assembly factor BamB
MRFSLLILLLALLSCQREIDFNLPLSRMDSVSTPRLNLGKEGQIYFTVNAYDSLMPGWNPVHPTNYVTFTGCFDIEKDTTVWMVRDSFVITTPTHKQGLTTTKTPYFENIVDGESIYRIYCPQQYNRSNPSSPLSGTFYLGVYFEQLNRRNGKREKLIQLLSPADVAASKQFGISNVVFDEARKQFFFGANNGFLYCYNLSGSMVWKKNDYQPRRFQNATYPFLEVANLYGKNNKLFFCRTNGTIEALEMNTGSKIWSKTGSNTPSMEELVVTNKYVFPIGQQAYIERLDINTGNPTTTMPYFSGISTSLSGYPGTITPYDVHINDSSIAFWCTQDSWFYVEDEPDVPGGVLQNVNMNGRCKYFSAHPTRLYGWTFQGGRQAVVFTCLDFRSDTIPWQWSVPATPNSDLDIYDFSFFRNNLFIISPMLSNNNPTPNNNRIVVSKLDAESGAILHDTDIQLPKGCIYPYAYGISFVN